MRHLLAVRSIAAVEYAKGQTGTEIAVQSALKEDRMKIHPAASAAISGSTPKQPPAQVGRDAIASQPDLGNQPFGKLVSLVARGLPLPTMFGETAPQTSDVTGSQPVS